MAYFNNTHVINAMVGYDNSVTDVYKEVFENKFGIFNYFPTAKKVCGNKIKLINNSGIKNEGGIGSCVISPEFSLTSSTFDRTIFFDLTTLEAKQGWYGARPIFLRRINNPNQFIQLYSIGGQISLHTETGQTLGKYTVQRVLGETQKIAVNVKAVETSPGTLWSYEVNVYLNGEAIINYTFNDATPYLSVFDFKFEYGTEELNNICIFDANVSAKKEALRKLFVSFIDGVSTASSIDDIKALALDVKSKL